jgi:hypothetical protein
VSICHEMSDLGMSRTIDPGQMNFRDSNIGETEVKTSPKS